MGLINLRLWIGDRSQPDPLAIASICFFGGSYSLFEVAWLHNTSPVEFGEIARWSQIASWGTVVSLAIFLRIHLRGGREWLFWSVIGLRTFGMFINFAMPVNIQYREVTAIEQITVLGEKLSYPIGVANPWHLVQALSLVLLLVYTIDACRSVWQRGERRKALVFGGGAALLSLTGLTMAGAIIWLSVKLPPFASPALMFVVLAMTLEFDYDLRRSKYLAHELTNREVELTEALEQLSLSANAGNVGIWARDLSTDNVWVNQKMRELYKFEDGDEITIGLYMEKVHPDDREALESQLQAAIESGNTYEAEYRIRLQNGDIRWVRSIGRSQDQDDGRKMIRGASVDITRRKQAEAEAHDLSHRLIDAQEKERARLARELHDGLSQSLAILSIQLQSLVNKDGDGIKKQVEKLTGQVQQLSTEIHRISHELHPSKISQLGLESALRGFCREVQAAHHLRVGFRAVGVARSLPNDISLCIYRIAQESLQNVIKHSGASAANVDLTVTDNILRLVITDNGSGFDTQLARSRESLGLISMQERIRAVDGTLTVDSVPDAGTKIEARVSLPKS